MDLLGVMYHWFLLKHEVIYEEFSAISRLNLQYALKLLPCRTSKSIITVEM